VSAICFCYRCVLLGVGVFLFPVIVLVVVCLGVALVDIYFRCLYLYIFPSTPCTSGFNKISPFKKKLLDHNVLIMTLLF
jgi:hypothetical protein